MVNALLITTAILLMLCASLVVLLVGRDRGASREENRLQRVAANLDEQLAAERAKVRHLQERNADLRDELDIATGAVESSVVAEVTAFLAHVNPEDFR